MIAVTELLDTNIIVDLLRGYSPAKTWISTRTQPGVTRAVWLEVIEGAQNKNDLERALKLLRDFALVEFVQQDFEWATTMLITYRLSHGVDTLDCLIAAPSSRLNLTLYTRNLKHFMPLLGNLAQSPY